VSLSVISCSHWQVILCNLHLGVTIFIAPLLEFMILTCEKKMVNEVKYVINTIVSMNFQGVMPLSLKKKTRVASDS
jgi:hypothetical protein